MKKLWGLFIICLSVSTLSAHTLLMNVMDNEDNTITVVGEFSTGELAAGALVRLESLVSGEVLFKKRLPEMSELVVSIPNEPYQVVLDGGPGHTIVREGIAPLEGFSAVQSKAVATVESKLSQAQNGTNEWSNPVIVLFALTLFLFIATLYFSSRNTNIILQQLNHSKKPM